MTIDFYTGSDFTQEYYHKDQLAVIKLLMEKQGFLKGAFYREEQNTSIPIKGRSR